MRRFHKDVGDILTMQQAYLQATASSTTLQIGLLDIRRPYEVENTGPTIQAANWDKANALHCHVLD